MQYRKTRTGVELWDLNIGEMAAEIKADGDEYVTVEAAYAMMDYREARAVGMLLATAAAKASRGACFVDELQAAAASEFEEYVPDDEDCE